MKKRNFDFKQLKTVTTLYKLRMSAFSEFCYPGNIISSQVEKNYFLVSKKTDAFEKLKIYYA